MKGQRISLTEATQLALLGNLTESDSKLEESNFIAAYWRENPQLSNGGYYKIKKVTGRNIDSVRRRLESEKNKTSYGSLSFVDVISEEDYEGPEVNDALTLKDDEFKKYFKESKKVQESIEVNQEGVGVEVSSNSVKIATPEGHVTIEPTEAIVDEIIEDTIVEPELIITPELDAEVEIDTPVLADEQTFNLEDEIMEEAKKLQKTKSLKTEAVDESITIEGLSGSKNLVDEFKNYKAYKNNFKPLVIVKQGKDYMVYKEDAKTSNDYVQFGTKDYIDGWMYGAVQARNKIIETKLVEADHEEDDKEMEEEHRKNLKLADSYVREVKNTLFTAENMISFSGDYESFLKNVYRDVRKKMEDSGFSLDEAKKMEAKLGSDGNAHKDYAKILSEIPDSYIAAAVYSLVKYEKIPADICEHIIDKANEYSGRKIESKSIKTEDIDFNIEETFSDAGHDGESRVYYDYMGNKIAEVEVWDGADVYVSKTFNTDSMPFNHLSNNLEREYKSVEEFEDALRKLTEAKKAKSSKQKSAKKFSSKSFEGKLENFLKSTYKSIESFEINKAVQTLKGLKIEGTVKTKNNQTKQLAFNLKRVNEGKVFSKYIVEENKALKLENKANSPKLVMMTRIRKNILECANVSLERNIK